MNGTDSISSKKNKTVCAGGFRRHLVSVDKKMSFQSMRSGDKAHVWGAERGRIYFILQKKQ